MSLASEEVLLDHTFVVLTLCSLGFYGTTDAHDDPLDSLFEFTSDVELRSLSKNCSLTAVVRSLQGSLAKLAPMFLTSCPV